MARTSCKMTGASWISTRVLDENASVSSFRRVFGNSRCKKIVKCEICASSTGFFDLYFNGCRLGNLCNDDFVYDELKCGQIEDNIVKYYKYDLMPLINKGKNCILAICTPIDGSQIDFIAKISICYVDGTEEEIGTDYKWQCINTCQLRKSNFAKGELFDSRFTDYSMMSASSYGDKEALPVFVNDTLNFSFEENKNKINVLQSFASKVCEIQTANKISKVTSNDVPTFKVKGETTILLNKTMTGWARFVVNGEKDRSFTISYIKDGNEVCTTEYTISGRFFEEYRPIFTASEFDIIKFSSEDEIEIYELALEGVDKASLPANYL